MPALNVVTVDPDELEVDIDLSQRGGATVTAYTDATGATPISLPATISARTDFWLPVNADYAFIVSVGGTERYRTTIGVSDRTDDPKTLLLRNALSLGDAAAGAGAGSGASSTSTGMTIGVPTLINASTVQIEVTSVYGIDGSDQPYYDPAGAAAGEAAKLDVDSSGNFFLIKPQGALAL